MLDIASLLGADRTETEIQMLETLEFEMKLAAVSMPRYLSTAIHCIKYSVQGRKKRFLKAL